MSNLGNFRHRLVRYYWYFLFIYLHISMVKPTSQSVLTCFDSSNPCDLQELKALRALRRKLLILIPSSLPSKPGSNTLNWQSGKIWAMLSPCPPYPNIPNSAGRTMTPACSEQRLRTQCVDFQAFLSAPWCNNQKQDSTIFSDPDCACLAPPLLDWVKHLATPDVSISEM